MRPTISVVLPFLGDEAEADRVLERLAAIRTRPGDEVIVADNGATGVVRPSPESGVTVVSVPERRSASHARNRGAASAGGEWLLFLDADCLPPAGLLDAYFDPPPDDDCGIVAGEIVGDQTQEAALARWARSRRGRWVAGLIADGVRPAGVTANMLVRRAAFEQAGGFQLGGGGDLDLSWRLQDAGWPLELRPQAVVRHRDRETLRGLGEQARNYGAHRRHLRRAHGPVVARPTLARPLARSLGAAAVWVARGEMEPAGFKLVDGFYSANAWFGALGGGPRRRRAD